MKEEWNIGQTVLNEYLVERILGEGGFGCSYLLRSNIKGRSGLKYFVTGVGYAAKRLVLPENIINNLRTELQAHAELPHHPNILELKFFEEC